MSGGNMQDNHPQRVKHVYRYDLINLPTGEKTKVMNEGNHPVESRSFFLVQVFTREEFRIDRKGNVMQIFHQKRSQVCGLFVFLCHLAESLHTRTRRYHRTQNQPRRTNRSRISFTRSLNKSHQFFIVAANLVSSRVYQKFRLLVGYLPGLFKSEGDLTLGRVGRCRGDPCQSDSAELAKFSCE